MVAAELAPAKQAILKLTDISIDLRSESLRAVTGFETFDKNEFAALKAHLTMAAQTALTNVAQLAITKGNGKIESGSSASDFQTLSKKETRLAVSAIVAVARLISRADSDVALQTIKDDAMYKLAMGSLLPDTLSGLSKEPKFLEHWESQIIPMAKLATKLFIDGGNTRGPNKEIRDDKSLVKIDTGTEVESLVPAQMRSRRASLADQIIDTIISTSKLSNKGQVSLASGTVVSFPEELPAVCNDSHICQLLQDYYSLIEEEICGGKFSPSELIEEALIKREGEDDHCQLIAELIINSTFPSLELFMPINGDIAERIDPFFALAIEVHNKFFALPAQEKDTAKLYISINNCESYKKARTFLSRGL